ncbi:hypothetical protein VCHA34P116_20481 [Vibrio chagasii]|nr:hypothetical protein VCHA35O137_20043 [Vibrio chagasii]CAH6901129.1 hypothetical protein VCHA34P116_20481 [Vibrio chagasii]CAH6908119.1 hypothetical protein VCHA32P90_20481 [Vibrio chagasii]CAH7184279.1 hypothetical protein VCHA39P230_20042 [Vibrio chagasii]CAH7196839.1 hypothetical protein VCHA37P194_20042 [Vibrio chagasii]
MNSNSAEALTRAEFLSIFNLEYLSLKSELSIRLPIYCKFIGMRTMSFNAQHETLFLSHT